MAHYLINFKIIFVISINNKAPAYYTAQVSKAIMHMPHTKETKTKLQLNILFLPVEGDNNSSENAVNTSIVNKYKVMSTVKIYEVQENPKQSLNLHSAKLDSAPE